MDQLSIYIQIKNDIKAKILSSEYAMGEQIISVREYSVSHKININTVNKAFAELDREGLTIIDRGKGRFVTTDEELIKDLKQEKMQEVIVTFIDTMKALGFKEEEILKLVKEQL